MAELDSWFFCNSFARCITCGTPKVLWLLFVKACSLICTRCLLKENVTLADQYFQMFCRQFLDVNGPTACTPNMHLHLHLKECLFDYGPPYAFWCYAYERYNGMLGNFPNNQKNIEPQLMKKCLLLQELHSKSFPTEGKAFQNILLQNSHCLTGGMMMSMHQDALDAMRLSMPTLQKGSDFTLSANEKCLPPLKSLILTTEMVDSLKLTYKLLYPDFETTNLQRFAKKVSRVLCAGEILGSAAASRDNNTIICAYWPSSSLNLENHLGHNFPLSIGQIQFFLSTN